MGFWTMLAEKVAIQADGEPDMQRGSRLENAALQRLADEAGLDIDLDPGMWLSDDDEDIAISPDSAEKSDRPTWAAEAKCLSSANHLKYMIRDIRARGSVGYRAIDYIPNERSCSFREQVVQYFVVNEDLKTLYFVLYDDRIGIDKFVMHVIVIKREDILEEIEKQKQFQLDILNDINQLILALAEEPAMAEV